MNCFREIEYYANILAVCCNNVKRAKHGFFALLNPLNLSCSVMNKVSLNQYNNSKSMKLKSQRTHVYGENRKI